MTSLLGHGVRLTLVFGNVGVDKVDDVGTDGRAEDGGHLDRLVGVGALDGVDFDLGPIGKRLDTLEVQMDGWIQRVGEQMGTI